MTDNITIQERTKLFAIRAIWIAIFIESEIVSENLFRSLVQEINSIIKILVKIIKSLKNTPNP